MRAGEPPTPAEPRAARHARREEGPERPTETTDRATVETRLAPASTASAAEPSALDKAPCNAKRGLGLGLASVIEKYDGSSQRFLDTHFSFSTPPMRETE